MHTSLGHVPNIAPEATAPRTEPALWRAIAFRFAFVYWMLILLVLAANEDTGLTWFGKLVRPVWNPIVVWVGRHMLGLSSELATAINGSGDKTADWVGVFLATAAATTVTLAWSVLDRRGTEHARLRALLRLVVRYTLAFALVGYGTSKLFCLQFPSPDAARLTQHYGDSSPMGLLWTFMGASPAYQFFAGAAETVGAVLLLFRRTTPLGALTLALVLVNVVLLNFCFDVPGKINSAHYLGMCVFLLLPVLGRLARVLFNRATQPVAGEPISPNRRVRWAARILKYGVIGFILLQDLQSALWWRARQDHDTAWYSGLWIVTRFARDGQDVPAYVTDATRWQRVRFRGTEDGVYARWRFMDDSYGARYAVVIDEQRHMMTFNPSDQDASKPPTGPLTLRYLQTDPDHLALEGRLGTTTLSVQLERLDAGKMLLVSRGFHWINEEPFSR
jgi:uncharacterized membrane protein YphA (DoxX/SURF4 family)